MDTVISSIDIPLLPTPSTSSVSPSVELRHDYEGLSSTNTDLSSANTSPEDSRTSDLKDCEVICPELKSCSRSNNIADSLKVATRKQRNSPVVYESQISPELEGIKLKIKKSPTQHLSHGPAVHQKTKAVLKSPKARKPAVAKGRKRKKKSKGESDDGTEDESAVTKNLSQYNGTSAEDDKNRAQSIWANERMPPEILTKIFMEVTYTEGCVPTLVR